MLNGSGKDRVSDTGKTTGQIVLPVGESRVGIFLLVECLQASTGFMESTELHTDLESVSIGGLENHGYDTYAGTNSNQWGQCALVESQWALILEDMTGTIKGTRVLCGCLQSHLDDICP